MCDDASNTDDDNRDFDPPPRLSVLVLALVVALVFSRFPLITFYDRDKIERTAKDDEMCTRGRGSPVVDMFFLRTLIFFG